jgi:hypothetical protein
MGRLLSAVLVCLGFGAFFSVAYANHSWGSYHWGRTANPFTLNLGNNLSGKWVDDPKPLKTPLDTAATDWGSSTVLDLEVVEGGTKDNPKKCRPTAGRVEVCNANYGGAWLGVAQIWISGSHIYQATTKVNDFYFNKPKYNTPAWRRLVMCQEIGHTFGLDHQDENFSNANLGTCMDYTSDPDGPLSNEHPNEHDYEQLMIIYEHTENTTSASQASERNVPPPAMNEIDFEGPGQWGKLVRSTRGGRLEQYELDFGGGHKIFTFVIWADEEDRGRGKPR